MDIDSDNDQTAAESLELQIPEQHSPTTSTPPREQPHLQPDQEEGLPWIWIWVFLWVTLGEVVGCFAGRSVVTLRFLVSRGDDGSI